jgi:hypothetical protein
VTFSSVDSPKGVDDGVNDKRVSIPYVILMSFYSLYSLSSPILRYDYTGLFSGYTEELPDDRFRVTHSLIETLSPWNQERLF